MVANLRSQQFTARWCKGSAIVRVLSVLLVTQMLIGCSLVKENKIFKPIPRVPLINANSPNRIPGEYIVVFKEESDARASEPIPVEAVLDKVKKQLGGTIMQTYSVAPRGFSAKLSERALEALYEEPSVDYIEVNQTGWYNTVQCDPTTQPCQCGTLACDPLTKPPAGLDRTSERGILPMPKTDGRYSYSEQGAGVHVYVIDSGIDHTHSEFGGRVEPGKKIEPTTPSSAPPDPLTLTDDCKGHGTHVAGIIGGTNVGIAKNAILHPVRVNQFTPATSTTPQICTDSILDRVVAAVKWVQAKAIRPAVVNLSVSFWLEDPNQKSALKTAVITSIGSGLPHVISAGNNNLDRATSMGRYDACSESPASVNEDVPNRAIVVGAVDPRNDTRWDVAPLVGSNTGKCLSLFAPGKDIKSAKSKDAPAAAPDTMSGTSQAAAHVTGVVARILGIGGNGSLTPNAVWEKVHYANNVKDDPMMGTSKVKDAMGNDVLWKGILPNPGVGSKNEMLHYGSLRNGFDDGDPHITAVNGIHYDFQDGGEFVALRDATSMEIQTRQTPVHTAPWVSVNTAITARVGQHRVTWQPNLSGAADPSGLQLRVDGVVTTIGERGLDLGGGGRVMKSPTGDRIEVDFPDGTALFAASHWWESQHQWYLDVHVFHTPATEGIMGDIEQDSWEKLEFANIWRVTDQTSLFDYAPGQSTKNYTVPHFPKEKIPPVKPENQALAERACTGFTNKNLLKDCLFDVAVTGDPIFAKSALVLQTIQHGATDTRVTVSRPSSRVREDVTFTATVVRHELDGPIPIGGVMFIVDGQEVGKAISLDQQGQARWETQRLLIGQRRISARYIPNRGSEFLPSRSLEVRHTVESGYQRYEP